MFKAELLSKMFQLSFELEINFSLNFEASVI